MSTSDIENLAKVRARLWGSFLLFTETFFPFVTGREFILSNPICRESHFITIARELTSVARLERPSLLINLPPGSGKSLMVSMFVAWTMSRHPNSQYLYISYGHDLAAKHTEMIRRIISNHYYQNLFGVEIRSDMKAKDHFQTVQGGSVKAFGSSGPITGHDAGLPHCNHFSGCIIIDDPHKPDEVHSDTRRANVKNNYQETILQRPRSPNVPIICIAHRLHEDDLPAFMLSGQDERKWHHVVLQSMDKAGNALYPEIMNSEMLLEKKEKSPYVFASQYQQEPVPAGGSLFKPQDFVVLHDNPKILKTFITADTAETSKSYNDATVFSFWGMYKLDFQGIETDQYGLHWIDCLELRIEPKDLKPEFLSFYGDCMLHDVKPSFAAIEKKSTGVTLISALDEVRGLQIREVKRTKADGNKTTRYLEIQPLVNAKLISFSAHAKHIDMCVDHMKKITASNTHRHDDIADTLYDACKIALIDKVLLRDLQPPASDKVLKSLVSDMKREQFQRSTMTRRL